MCWNLSAVPVLHMQYDKMNIIRDVTTKKRTGGGGGGRRDKTKKEKETKVKWQKIIKSVCVYIYVEKYYVVVYSI